MKSFHTFRRVNRKKIIIFVPNYGLGIRFGIEKCLKSEVE